MTAPPAHTRVRASDLRFRASDLGFRVETRAAKEIDTGVFESLGLKSSSSGFSGLWAVML